eukprot:6866327-Pyramimonas_sp.AAC.1
MPWDSIRAPQASRPWNAASGGPTKYTSPKYAKQSPCGSTARTEARPRLRSSAVPTASKPGLMRHP